MYKVFINDKPVIFSAEDETSGMSANALKVFVRTPDIMMANLNRFMSSSDYDSLVFTGRLGPNPLFREFASLFRCLEAAGGIVHNRLNQRLYIYRFGKWDLPKGKIEKYETPEMAALREVTEETGISGQKIVSPLPTTYHMYDHKGNRILKKTYWYMMDYQGSEQPKPQTEESITDARWFGMDELDTVRFNTYASLLEIVDADAAIPGQ